ncbi:hypothetical protein RB201_04200 [Streptomyces sp. S1A(2023)]
MRPATPTNSHPSPTRTASATAPSTAFPKTAPPGVQPPWVAFTATTEAGALAAKQAAYGDAEFLHELPADKQIEIIEIADARSDHSECITPHLNADGEHTDCDGNLL